MLQTETILLSAEESDVVRCRSSLVEVMSPKRALPTTLTMERVRRDAAEGSVPERAAEEMLALEGCYQVLLASE